jgi:hypothetical protein
MGRGGDEEEYNVCAPNVLGWRILASFLVWRSITLPYCVAINVGTSSTKGPGATPSFLRSLDSYVRMCVCWSVGLDICVDSGNEFGSVNLHVAPPPSLLTM